MTSANNYVMPFKKTEIGSGDSDTSSCANSKKIPKLLQSKPSTEVTILESTNDEVVLLPRFNDRGQIISILCQMSSEYDSIKQENALFIKRYHRQMDNKWTSRDGFAYKQIPESPPRCLWLLEEAKADRYLAVEKDNSGQCLALEIVKIKSRKEETSVPKSLHVFSLSRREFPEVHSASVDRETETVWTCVRETDYNTEFTIAQLQYPSLGKIKNIIIDKIILEFPVEISFNKDRFALYEEGKHRLTIFEKTDLEPIFSVDCAKNASYVLDTMNRLHVCHPDHTFCLYSGNGLALLGHTEVSPLVKDVFKPIFFIKDSAGHFIASEELVPTLRNDPSDDETEAGPYGASATTTMTASHQKNGNGRTLVLYAGSLLTDKIIHNRVVQKIIRSDQMAKTVQLGQLQTFWPSPAEDSDSDAASTEYS